MKKLKFAIIGCGRIADRHAEHINNLGLLVATCDKVPEKAKELGEKFNAQYYEDIDAMLKNEDDIDIVAICTPNGLHAEHTIKSLNAGFHVLVEKPMSLSVHDSGEMIKAAERANKRLFVVKQNRFNPPVKKVKELIESGKLGKIYSVQLNCFWNRNDNYYKSSDWKGTKELDGGILFTQFSHFIDLLYWFFGDVKCAHSISRNYNHHNVIEFEDTGVSILDFYSGIIGTVSYTINAYRKNMEGSITIFAEKGTVKIGGQYINELEYQIIEGLAKIEVDKGNPPNNYGEYIGSMSNHEEVYRNVIDVLNNNGKISTNGFEGLKTVEIIDKIYASNGK
jgi:UDP-N-acetyl-2-amino-2-deoxyglucuronate dehydrogenase